MITTLKEDTNCDHYTSWLVPVKGPVTEEVTKLRFLYQHNKPDEMISLVNKLKGWTKDTVLQNHIGLAYQLKGELKKSDEHLIRSFDIAPNVKAGSISLSNRANNELRRQDYEKAFALAMTALDLNHLLPNPWLVGLASLAEIGTKGDLENFSKTFLEVFRSLDNKRAIVKALLYHPFLASFSMTDEFTSILDSIALSQAYAKRSYHGIQK